MKCQVCFAALPRGANWCEVCGASPQVEAQKVKEINERPKLKKVSSKKCDCLLERGIALLLDGFIVTALAKFAQSNFVALQSFAETLQSRWGEIGQHAPFYFVVLVLYYSLMEGSPLHATVGKRLCGIKVTDLYGRGLNPLRAFIRGLSRILSIASHVGYFLALFTERQRALHDLLAGSVVQSGPITPQD